jgi:hypothetical protein
MEVFTGGLFTPEAARVASQGVEAASQLMRKETADGG